MTSQPRSQTDAEAQAEFLSIQPQHNITQTTSRLLLRPVQRNDIIRLHEIRHNPEVMAFMQTGAETEPNPLKSYSFSRLKMMTKPGFLSFAIELLPPTTSDTSIKPPELIGFIGITRATELFYILDQPYWGRGYATECIKAFLPHYWAQFPRGVPETQEGAEDALLGYVLDGNASSEKVLLKAGFELVVRGLVNGDEQAVFAAFRPGKETEREEILTMLKVREDLLVQVR